MRKPIIPITLAGCALLIGWALRLPNTPLAEQPPTLIQARSNNSQLTPTNNIKIHKEFETLPKSSPVEGIPSPWNRYHDRSVAQKAEIQAALKFILGVNLPASATDFKDYDSAFRMTGNEAKSLIEELTTLST